MSSPNENKMEEENKKYKWRKEHPDRWKEIQNKSSKKHRENNREELNRKHREWRENNKEKAYEMKKISIAKKPEYYKMKNREKMKKSRLKYKARVYTDNKFRYLKTNCLYLLLNE